MKPRKVVFKPYDQDSAVFEAKASSMIPEEHLARIVSEAVDSIPLEGLEKYYGGGGTSSYHPKMMLKVWIYGYCNKIFTSRRLAKALRESIPFIWLSGGQQPCFKSLCSFRSSRMEGMVDLIFGQVLGLLAEEGYIDLEDLFIDGSFMEANANKHKVVWAKNTARYKAMVSERVGQLLSQARGLQLEEDRAFGVRDLPEMGGGRPAGEVLGSEEVSAWAERLGRLVEEEAAAEEERRKAASLKKKLEEEAGKLKKYEAQEETLCGRSSYSKTDTDATAMRMKDKLTTKPAYNVQAVTCHNYCVDFGVYQTPNDASAFGPQMGGMSKRLEAQGLPRAKRMSGDAGYGTEENYVILEDMGTEGHLKYPSFYREVSGALAKEPYRRENFAYDAQADVFTCPQGRALPFAEERQVRTSTGYIKAERQYRCESCEGCPVAELCKRGGGPRTLALSRRFEACKGQAKERLCSDKGQELRSRRGPEMEGFFGDIKHNLGYTRMILRGKQKVYIEWGMLAIAHNLRKVFVERSGIWREHYARRAAAKATKKAAKAA
jgi:transposase